MLSRISLSAGLLLAITIPAKATPQQKIKLYLVQLGDEGRNGRRIGCGDSLVPVTVSIPRTTAPLTAALRLLLATPRQFTGQPNLSNYWGENQLKLNSVSVHKGTATIRFSGSVQVAGICDLPRIEEQIDTLVRQFPTVKRSKIFVGNQTLQEAIS